MVSYIQIELCVTLTVFGIIYQASHGKGQVLNPTQRAEKLYQNFAALPLLLFGKQCASPEAMRNKYVEALLEIHPDVLTDRKVVDSISIYNRWQKYGGYRCDPSRFSCKQKPGSTQIWTCQCPMGELGTQKVEVDENNQCIFKGEGSFDPPMKNTECSGIIPVTDLPQPYDTEIICGIFKEDKLMFPPAKRGTLSIESGIHYYDIKCPAGQECLMKEFDSKCTVENSDKLTQWIKNKNNKYDFVVVDRRMTWPPCTCSNKAPQPFPSKDPRQLEIDTLLESLPRATWGQSCDRSRLNNLESCINANWYLIQQPQFDTFKKVIDEIRMQAFSPVKSRLRNALLRVKRQAGGRRSDCVQSSGLFCNDDLICSCRRVPYLPGFSPEVPTKVNSKGVCELDTGSDCLFNQKMFECSDRDNCLLAKHNVTCTEKNYKAAMDKYWAGFEQYQRRCHCTNAKVEKNFREVVISRRSNGHTIWKSPLEISNHVGLFLLPFLVLQFLEMLKNPNLI